MSESKEVSFDGAEQAAISHAWDYFAFHAQQRQTVFNFFLILVGASVAAYASTLAKADGSHDHFRLAERTDVADMTILSKADTKIERGILSNFETFSQIYRRVFILAGAGGLAVLALSIKRIWS
jgi:hypothetical protein